jgi:hypothetical protein
MGTQIDIQYDYGDPVEETFAGPTRDGNGYIPLALNDVPRVGSVEVEWPVEMTDVGVVVRAEWASRLMLNQTGDSFLTSSRVHGSRLTVLRMIFLFFPHGLTRGQRWA